MKRLIITTLALLAGSMCLLTPSASGDIITDLLSYWKLDESSGDAIDAHGDVDLTVSGASYGGTGIINDGFDFDGNDKLRKTGITGNPLDATDLSMVAWVNPTALGGFQRILGAANTGGSNRYSLLFNGDKLAYQIDGTGHADPSTTAVSDGVLTHIAVVFDASANNVKYYINGTLDGNEPTDANEIDANLTIFCIGANSDGNLQFFTGVIDEVGVWNKALTQAEITALYNGGNGLAYPLTEEEEEAPTRRRRLLIGGI